MNDRWDRAIRWAMVGLVLVLGLWGALSWSLIPQAVDGRVDRIGYHSDTGYRFWVLRLDDGRALVVDRQVVSTLGPAKMEGRAVSKDRWSTTLHVGNRTTPAVISSVATLTLPPSKLDKKPQPKTPPKTQAANQ